MASVQYALAADFAKHGLPAAALDGFTGDVDQILTKSSAKVNSYLRGRYKLPLTAPVPDEIIEATCWLAAYSVMTVRGYDPNNDCDLTIESRYRDLIGRPMQPGWLQEVARGRVNLDVSADATPATSEGGPIVIARGGSSSRCSRHSSYGHGDDDCWRFW